ncbi:hypothetical protein PMZ80_010826 [Knufia obscura]|nr:hypothetical protein PMZ80_010826 [Knufia obscura]
MSHQRSSMRREAGAKSVKFAEPDPRFKEDVEASSKYRRGWPPGKPRLLDLDGLRTKQVRKLDSRDYELRDVIKTLVYHSKGCDSIKSLLETTTYKDFKIWHRRTNKEGHKEAYKFLRRGKEASVCHRVLLRGDSNPDNKQIWIYHEERTSGQAGTEEALIGLYFVIKDNGAWKAMGCRIKWEDRGLTDPGAIQAVSLLITKRLLREIALMQKDQRKGQERQ